MSLTIAFRDARDAVTSYAAASGYFDAVMQHEPKSAPGKGLSLAVWARRWRPDRQGSGLRSTTVRFEMTLQVRCSMLREPQDDIDLDMIEAADALCAALSGDFDLGASVKNVDLLGEAENGGLGGDFGYVDHDGHKYRVLDVGLACTVNDVWTQVM